MWERPYAHYITYTHPASACGKWAAALCIVPDSPAFREIWLSLPDWLHETAAEMRVSRHTVLHVRNILYQP